MSPLRKILNQQIARQGVLTFEQFMELALYCPELGYYERKQDTVGHGGDFFTSVSVGSIFGELLGFQFAQWLTVADPGSGGSLRIVEAGAHDGRLAGDLLNYFREFHPEVFHRLEYWILEPSPTRQGWQSVTLAPFSSRVHWARDWKEFPDDGVRGLIFSNELLDAFPVRKIGWDAVKKTFFEWGVTSEGGRFVWVRIPLENKGGTPVPDSLSPSATTRVESAMGLKFSPELLDVLPEGFTTEFCPAATAWWREAAGKLRSGRLLAIDYGLAAENFFQPERAQGTLRAYRQHRLVTDLLDAPGEQDLTAHVNFTTIQLAGEAAGLRTEGLETQANFLVRIAEAAACPGAPFQKWTPARLRQFQTLTHPEHLGRSFRVLVQTR